MYIIIIGGGKVGYYLTEHLLKAGNEVVVIEKNPKKVQIIINELGGVAIQGDGSDAGPMLEAGMNRADIVVAATGDDEDNLIICQMAKKKFNVKRTIARINNPKNEHIFSVLGIDSTVSYVDALVAQIEREIPAHSLIHLLTLRDVGAAFIEKQVPEDSPVIGIPMNELSIPQQFLIALVIREGQAIIPKGTTKLLGGDEVVAVTTLEQEDLLERLFRGELIRRQ
ncbi:MAG: TrkA family potassium uptake protein [Chloroflexota bacterium]|nr:MAG: TrkA family potassium uptake protein [Chloroflexota bacterium]